MILDFETLKIIWWLFIGVLMVAFALTDGFDLGVGTLLPFVGRNDEERRVIINTIGPHWDGNQVWLITAGAALFAAWPLVYATAFSLFYVALLLALFALLFRPLAFDYRSKLGDPRWRAAWDWGLFVGGAVPALVFGVAFGNLLQGVPFHFDADLRSYSSGGFWELLNPFGLLCGLVSLAMLVGHGAVYLQLRTEGEIARRCKKAVSIAVPVLLTAFAAAGVWIAFGIEGYRIVSAPDFGGLPNPLAKTVEKAPGLWLDNFTTFPWLASIPALAFLAGASTRWLALVERPGAAFIASGITLACIILTAGFSMYPFLLPSSSHPDSGLTVWDASASLWTLQAMFWVTVFFLPVVVLYTGWAYRKLRGKITIQDIRERDHSAY